MGVAALQSPFGAPPAPEDVRLPPLRDDLELLPAPPAADGSPCWSIHDPVRNRYFRIGHAAFEVLARWRLGTARAISAAVAAETLEQPTAEDVLEVHRFLSGNNLTLATDTAFLERQAAARRTSWFLWLVHNYLFFRVPLVRPDRFLAATLWLVAPFYTRTWRWTVIGAGVLGVVLASRQWDAFLHSFLHFFSWEGAALYGATLLASKMLHELGHGYTAKRFGCRVPTMGLAFLVLWPVLYTDTTDAWRLVSRRQRLAIAAGGMLVELSLAAFATLAWSFLPDGPLRSAAFLVATVTWVTTLAINLSPFMRFDGYYLLADALDMPNLQDRAFGVARWQLREWLFGFGEEPPEHFAPRLRTGLLVYSFSTWIYRLVLFLGIAVLVYQMFFKALGILLFMVEIVWFIARPLWGEAKEWWRRRDRLRPNRHLLATLAGLGGLVWLAAVPVAATVAVPAVWRAGAFATLYPPVPARVEEVLTAPGQRVGQGELLVRLSAPELDSQRRQTALKIELLQAQIARLSAGQEGLERVRVMEEELAALLAERAGQDESRARLEVRAPQAGMVVDVDETLRPGRWVNPRGSLAVVVEPGAGELVGYVAEVDLERVQVGAAATFYPDDFGRAALKARVTAVDRLNARTLDVAALAATQGGSIAVETASAPPSARSPGLKPLDAIYRVTLAPEGAAPAQVVRGVVRVEAEARSLAIHFWRTAVAVLIREAGF